MDVPEHVEKLFPSFVVQNNFSLSLISPEKVALITWIYMMPFYRKEFVFPESWNSKGQLAVYKEVTTLRRSSWVKTGLEEMSPINVRKENRTRGHVFICMLAYKLLFHIWKYFEEDLSTSDKFGSRSTQQYILDCLDEINYIEYQFENTTIKILPKIFNDDQQYILDKLKIKLPQIL